MANLRVLDYGYPWQTASKLAVGQLRELYLLVTLLANLPSEIGIGPLADALIRLNGLTTLPLKLGSYPLKGVWILAITASASFNWAVA